MIQKFIELLKKKSPKERFLLVMGGMFFLIYFVLGLAVLFWKAFPFAMEYKYRLLFGGLLIGYSFIRFYRFYSDNKN